MAKYFQEEIECAPRERIRAMQDEKLRKQVRHVWENVPYYRKKMEEKGVTPEDISSTSDLHKLPFLSKADLRNAYPYGLLACPLKDCVRIHSTSGTTGKRVIAFYTQADIDMWSECAARAIVAAGGEPEDVCQISYGYGLFRAGRRLPQGRLPHRPHQLRQHGQADHVPDGSQGHHSLLHPQLCSLLRGITEGKRL